MADVQGFCDERFRPLEDAFRDFLERGVDKGASLAVNRYGEPVVDLWGGTRDYEESMPWDADTVVRVFSTSKVVVMIAVLLIVDRGLLDLDVPIANYWPEFRRNGKDEITARQVLLHRSGLPGFGRKVSYVELGDWDHVMELLEDAPLWYEPGAISCYHPQTYGFLLGELVRRLGGVPFDEFVRRELTQPLEADFHFSFTDSPSRVAALWPAERGPEFDSEMASKVFAELSAIGEWADPQYLPTVIPAGSGVTNARALARLGSVIACRGEVDGHRYVSEEAVAEAGREQSFAHDEMLGPLRLGLGFGLDSEGFPAPTPTTLHWGGYGGSFLTMDPATGSAAALLRANSWWVTVTATTPVSPPTGGCSARSRTASADARTMPELRPVHGGDDCGDRDLRYRALGVLAAGLRPPPGRSLRRAGAGHRLPTTPGPRRTAGQARRRRGRAHPVQQHARSPALLCVGAHRRRGIRSGRRRVPRPLRPRLHLAGLRALVPVVRGPCSTGRRSDLPRSR